METTQLACCSASTMIFLLGVFGIVPHVLGGLLKSRAPPRVIGRMVSVSPTEGERYCLYLLLLVTPGAPSYEALGFAHCRRRCLCLLSSSCGFATRMTTTTLQCKTFWHLRLLRGRGNSSPWSLCLARSLSQSSSGPFQADLYEEFARALPQDLACLRDLQSHLERHSRSLRDFGLPLPADFNPDKLRELRSELAFDVPTERSATLRAKPKVP